MSTTSLVGGEPLSSVPAAAIDLASSTTTLGFGENTTAPDVLGTDSSVAEMPSSTTTSGTTTTTLAVVAGLFVAGDASRRMQLTIVAAAEGAEAAAVMNAALLEQDLK